MEGREAGGRANGVGRHGSPPEQAQGLLVHLAESLGRPQVRLRELIGRGLADNPIAVADHCYGCTAGQGSSCGGALAP